MKPTESRRPKVPEIDEYLQKLGALEAMQRQLAEALRQKQHLEATIAELEQQLLPMEAQVAASQKKVKDAL